MAVNGGNIESLAPIGIYVITIATIVSNCLHYITVTFKHVGCSRSRMDGFFNKLSTRIESKCLRGGVRGSCKLWTGYVNKGGYGRMKITMLDGSVKFYYVHRVAYMLKIRDLDLPVDLEVSHLCNNKTCVTPEHLCLVTSSINKSRKTCFSVQMCMGHDPPCVI